MSIVLPWRIGLFGKQTAGYETGAVTFDGANDFMLRGSGWTGDADGKAATVALWVKFGVDGSQLYIMDTPNAFWGVWRDASNKVNVSGNNAAGTPIIVMASTSSWVAADGWTHLLITFNLAATTGKIYKDGVDDTAAGGTYTDDSVDFTRTEVYWGQSRAAGNRLNADVADYWEARAYINDPTKFVRSGKPVDLGVDGTLPGATPIAFFKHVTGAAATDFATNIGTGGNMSITGTLTEAATSPSD